MSTNDRPHLKITQSTNIQDRIFQGRGGGGSYPRTEYAAHGRKVFAEAQALIANFESSEDRNLIERRYFKAEVPEEFDLLTSDGKKIESNLLSKLVVIQGPTLGFFSSPTDSLNDILTQLARYKDTQVGKAQFSSIEALSLIDAYDKVSEDLRRSFEEGTYSGEALLTLFPDLTEHEQLAIRSAISEYLVRTGDGSLSADLPSEQGRIIRVKASKEKISDLVNGFMSIQSADSIEEIVSESSVTGPSIEDGVIVHSNFSEAKVCIFDTGVERTSRFLQESIIDQLTPKGPPHNVGHGTFVASRIIFGDSLRDDISAGQLRPDVKVLSVCLVGHDAIGNPVRANGEEFLRILRKTVEQWHQQIKVYNLSMNLVVADGQVGALVSDREVGIAAAEIDKLSRRYGVLFVISAGNYPISSAHPPPSRSFPDYFDQADTRICKPAEAMLALTVGSVAQRENGGSVVKSNDPSPFTRKGPGFAQYRKPDLLAHGGNLPRNWSTFPELAVAGIDGTGYKLAFGNGTSYSTPLISRIAAKLFERLPGATADLVRAIIVHSASCPPWPCPKLRWDA